MDGFVGDLPTADGLAESVNAPTYTNGLNIPSSQPDFNTVSTDDPTRILTAVAGAVTNVAGAIGAVQQVNANVAYNRAVAQQGQTLALQSLAAQGKIATLQTQTQLAQAQQAYNKAAGIVSDHTGLIVILGVAGLVIAGLQLFAKKK